MTWRVLLVDDEPLARLRLRKLVIEAAAQMRFGAPDDSSAAGAAAGAGVALDIVDAESAAQALQAMVERDFDVLLLDIQLPGKDGLSLARQLRDAARQRGAIEPSLVFVTAHAEHALAAFDVQALDYLTKPVRRDRLLQALQRCWAVRATQSQPEVARAPGETPGSTAAEGLFVIVQDRTRVVRVPAVEVLWLKAELKYVTVRTATDTWMVDESLAELEGRLGPRFLRIHRNALVARGALRSLKRTSLTAERGDASAVDPPGDAADGWAVQVMPSGEWLAVSRRQLAAVRACLASDPTSGA